MDGIFSYQTRVFASIVTPKFIQSTVSYPVLFLLLLIHLVCAATDKCVAVLCRKCQPDVRSGTIARVGPIILWISLFFPFVDQPKSVESMHTDIWHTRLPFHLQLCLLMSITLQPKLDIYIIYRRTSPAHGRSWVINPIYIYIY